MRRSNHTTTFCTAARSAAAEARPAAMICVIALRSPAVKSRISRRRQTKP